ncbi:MAG: hypothetical protein HFG59_00675 [Lachnospiraceae bacterium]|nr:hypothetical protein [Lachnospiraceae bacterium]
MKKFYLGMLFGIMVLAAGCGSQSAGAVASGEETETTVAESQTETEAETEKETEASEKDNTDKGEAQKDAEESIQAAEESLKALEESLKAAEESLAAEEEQPDRITDYGKLVGVPSDYLQKQVRFTGRIVRFAPIGSTEAQIVLAVNGRESNRVVGEYKRNIVNTDLAVGDQITLSGEFQGMVRYRMQTGGTESMPTVDIEEIRDIVKAQPETLAATLPETSAPEGMETNEETTPEGGAEPGQESQGSQEIGEESESGQQSPVISAGE